ncbi:3D domain-containing protein [Paenibacillus hexagrammi]|uniref:Ubiquitin-like domain-containing protein n=1 Tax=Paenibacillus hexagrammi TaxID=2908839 RepID=A0ABY3SGR3_9BACL|nr:3D domain-containing protein [Paenibacillus sp. YPD9-1]UJF33131.1 ubiquitin-like domain-containing protein [Paenibacillus sp. YPD9-1]
MGNISLTETHVSRSSSMSLALRWKHENLRLILSLGLISIAMTFMFLVLLYGTATKSVSVVVNGQETVVHTKQWVLQRLLDEQAIKIGEHDEISAALNTKIKGGEKFVIEHASPIQLTADGKTTTVYTTARTVESALQDLHIALGDLDKVTPEPTASLTSGDEIKVVRVKKEIEEMTEPIAFDTEKKNDASILKGKEQVVQEGKEGVLLKKKEKTFEDGVLVSEAVVDEQVQSESVNKIVAIGTKNPVVVLSASSPSVDEIAKNGVKFGYKQILKNVKLTAYSAGVASTGKSKDSPGYGKTYTGTTVTEGRTIAVDPKVVPLGWWVYIEGVGFRRAEDIGSGVKGQMIDVYYDDESHANRFGTKSGFTVYIIGPKKPTEN